MNSFSPTEDTIAAIATAVSPGQGSIAVIRISGSLAIEAFKSKLIKKIDKKKRKWIDNFF